MTDYGQQIVRDYCEAILKAERLLKNSEHDVWTTEVSGLYRVSQQLRDAMLLVHEEMYQKLVAEDV